MGGLVGRRLRSSGDLLGGGLGLRGSGDVPVRILGGGCGLGIHGSVLLRLGSGRRIDGGPVLLRLGSFGFLGDCSVLGGGDVGDRLLDVAVLVLLSDGLAFSVVPFGVLDLLYHSDRFALGLIPFGIRVRGGFLSGCSRTVRTDIRLGLDFAHGTVRPFRRHLVLVRRASVLVLGRGVGFGFEPSIVSDGGLLIIGLASISTGNILHRSDIIDEAEIPAIGVVPERPVVVDTIMVLYPILVSAATHIHGAEAEQIVDPPENIATRICCKRNVLGSTRLL